MASQTRKINLANLTLDMDAIAYLRDLVSADITRDSGARRLFEKFSTILEVAEYDRPDE